jgi:Uma2 family endonuclease
MPLFAHHGVRFAWLVDPEYRTLEAYRPEGGRWSAPSVFRDDDRVSVEPFADISIHLADPWA